MATAQDIAEMFEEADKKVCYEPDLTAIQPYLNQEVIPDSGSSAENWRKFGGGDSTDLRLFYYTDPNPFFSGLTIYVKQSMF